MAHVGIQRLRAGDRQEHGAHERQAGVVVAADEELDAMHRVQRAQHLEVLRHADRAGDRDEQEPDEHGGTEHLADALGAARLHGEQDHDDHRGDQQRQARVLLEHALQCGQRLQAFDGRADRHRRCEHRIREECGPADHRGNDEPFAVFAQQRVQREDAAFALVVHAHADEHVFDGRDERHRPEHQREHAYDRGLVGMLHTALTGEERLHRVQRRGADVSVHHAQRHDRHGQCHLVGAGLQRPPPATHRTERLVLLELGGLLAFLFVRLDDRQALFLREHLMRHLRCLRIFVGGA